MAEGTKKNREEFHFNLNDELFGDEASGHDVEGGQGVGNSSSSSHFKEYFYKNDVVDLKLEQVKGMEFSLLAKAPELYFSYAHVMGFGVRLGGTKADASGNVVTKYYYYNKEVKHVDKWMNHKKRVQNPQDMSRNRCKVRMRVAMTKGEQG
ncbi:hypothetical protein GOBAR_DD28837 [Gossypium barbadense]|nr:hypothetical protein GOBAR_DD28837 [Gossypium barbadense]